MSGEQRGDAGVHSPTVPVRTAALHLVRQLTADVDDDDTWLDRYAAHVYLRSVLEAAAEQLTVLSGCDLMDLRCDGVSPAAIAQQLQEAGFDLKASGVRHLLELARRSIRTAPVK